MTALVPHRRPELGTDGIQSRLPVSADDQQQMAGLANFCSGHGGMLIPWCAVGKLLDDESVVFHFYVGPKARAVERIWRVMLSGSTPATITAGSAAAVDVPVGATAATYTIREPLSAKTSTAGDTSITITSVEAGQLTVHAIAMYEQTRAVLALDSTDYGVDITTLQARDRVFDTANRSLRGLADGYKNVDARRAGIFHWTGGPLLDFLAVTQASYTDLFVFYAPALGAITEAGGTTTSFRVAVYAKVNAGSADVQFLSAEAGDSLTINVTSTSYAWVTDDLDVDAEDLSLADGRRGSAWETIQVQARKGTATTLSIAAISVIRVTTPL